MRHRVAHRKLGRTTEHRMAMLRNLCTSLIVEERVVTTVAKAKELRSFAERAITLAKRGLTADSPEKALSYRRRAARFFIGGHAEIRLRYISDKKRQKRVIERTGGVRALKKLFDEIGPRYLERPGGYTRVIKLGWRRGDGADMAVVELVEPELKKKEKSQESSGEA
ncbi:MAG: 50S ribosomal protein L17 [Acidobacteria bacterium]|nr:MAG: 50S ribosomal protein L17 [Acidobacteriota bacterium]